MIGAAIAESLSSVPVSGFVFDPRIHLGPNTPSGEVINENTALTCAAVRAAVGVLSDTVATLPLGVFEHLPNGGNRPAPEHPVHRVIHDVANEETTSFIWREVSQGHLGTWGNAYSEIELAANGNLLNLWQRSPDPTRTKPVRRTDVDGKMWYQLHNDRGQESWMEAKKMLHVPGLSFDGTIGYSPVFMMRDLIGVNKAAERYAGELFKNDARQNGYITLPTELSKDAYDRMKTSINDSGSAHGNRHKMGILEGGATFANGQMNPEDVQMIDARKFGVEEVARAYRISPPMLQDLTHGTFSNITELGRQFIVYTMQPWLERWKAEINRKLLALPFFCDFNVRAFMKGDPKARADYYFKLFSIGGTTVNKILELEDDNPIGPEGDERFVPANLIPLKFALAAPPKPKEPQPPVEKDERDDDDENKDPALATLAFRNATRELHVKEGKAAQRQADNGGNFTEWLDTFFDDTHLALCEKKLEVAARLASLEATHMAIFHVGESKRMLLEAAECKPGELPERIAHCVARWDEIRTIDISNLKENTNE